MNVLWAKGKKRKATEDFVRGPGERRGSNDEGGRPSGITGRGFPGRRVATILHLSVAVPACSKGVDLGSTKSHDP